MGSTSNNSELNIEELINCVHIGKTLISNTRSRKPHQDLLLSPCTSRKHGDFDPLLLPSTPKPHIEEDLGVSVQCKRLKQANQSPESSMDHVSKTDTLHNECIQQASTTSVLCDDSNLKKIRRKRILLDEDLTTLKTPDSKPPCPKKPLLQNAGEPIASIKGDNLNHLKDHCSPSPQIETGNGAVRSWLPPSPDSLSEDEKETASQNVVTAEDCDVQEKQSAKDPCHSLKVVLHSMVITEPSDMSEKSSKILSNPAQPPLEDETTTLHSTTNDQDCEQCSVSTSPPTTELTTPKPNNEPCSSPAKRSLRSNQKHIRKKPPPLQVRQTPMGLPKPLRIKKEKFSVEEIYMNKNYSTPVPKPLETIFEYPKQEKDGTTKYVEKRRRARAIYFYTNPSERPTKKRKKQGKRVSTRRNKAVNDVQESNSKLHQILAELDEQLQLHNLSPR